MKKETKRQREIRLLRNQIKRLEAQREAAIRMLVKAEVELPGLLKRFRRLDMQRLKLFDGPVPDAGVTQDPLPGPAERVADDGGGADDQPVLHHQPGSEPGAAQDDGGIPDFLRRTSLSGDVAQAAYAVANAHNAPPTPEQKKLVEKEKRQVKEERKQAVLTGKTRRWPVSGRDAEKALRRR